MFTFRVHQIPMLSRKKMSWRELPNPTDNQLSFISIARGHGLFLYDCNGNKFIIISLFMVLFISCKSATQKFFMNSILLLTSELLIAFLFFQKENLISFQESWLQKILVNNIKHYFLEFNINCGLRPIWNFFLLWCICGNLHL